MSQNLGQIIRKNQIRNAGTCRLDQHVQQPQSILPKNSVEHTRTPQVRIIETTAAGIMIEFTCSCGSKANIQCDYDMEK